MLALRADDAVLIVNDAATNADAPFVAQALAAAIRKIGPFDLVMLGREAGDWGSGQTGGLLAEELGRRASRSPKISSRREAR